MTRNNAKPLRKRGRKGGVRQRLRKMKHKPPLPSMILANVRCLKGLKMDELRANATFFNEYRDACLIVMPWLSPRLGSTKMLAIVGHSSRDLDTPPGLIATSRRPERRKVGVFVYMSTSVGAKPSLCVNSSAPRTLNCCQCHYGHCISPANFHNSL